MSLAARSLVVALAAAALLLACGGRASDDPPGETPGSPGSPGSPPVPAPDQCADCGPCGIVGGPNPEDAIVLPLFGTLSTGEAAVVVELRKRGQCGDAGATPYVLTFADSIARLSPRDPSTTIDTKTAEYKISEYVWNDRTLRLRFIRTTDGKVTFHFTDATGEVTTVCGIAARAVTCS